MLWTTILIALQALRRNLMRSALTMLGVVIGVAAVIVMVAIGNGATLQVTRQIETLGTNLLMVMPGQRLGPGQSVGAAPFTTHDAQALARELPSVAAVAPSASRSLMTVYGNANWTTSITGTTAAYLTARGWPLETGRSFSPSELRAGAPVCLVGATVRSKLFGAQSPLGRHFRVQNFSCEVIGLLRAKGQAAMGMDQDDVVLMPLRTFHRRIAGNQDVRTLLVKVRAGASTERVKSDIEHVLRQRRHISALEEDNFNVMDMKEITQTLTSTTQVLTALLSAVAAVSLLVGGIGIMNIMLVSVTERTREIGIRLAIGALERDVLLQFLLEAVVLSSCGGLVGVLCALAASFGLSRVLGVPFVFDLGIVVLAFLFSVVVGVVFGYVPARRAARLDPIVALRHE